MCAAGEAIGMGSHAGNTFHERQHGAGNREAAGRGQRPRAALASACQEVRSACGPCQEPPRSSVLQSARSCFAASVPSLRRCRQGREKRRGETAASVMTDALVFVAISQCLGCVGNAVVPARSPLGDWRGRGEDSAQVLALQRLTSYRGGKVYGSQWSRTAAAAAARAPGKA